jgi:putative salt-induced outer membrane protein YdiY
MHSLYLADRPDFDGDDELSMISEFGFLLANGNTNASTITAKINTSQELESWSYQIIGSGLYKQSQQELEGKKGHAASAQKLFLSGQLDHKLTEPDDRLFVYCEYENNRFSGFRYQAALAAGWTSRLWHDKQSEFKYSVGPGFGISEVEENNSEEDTKGLIVRAAMEYKRKFSNSATFRQFVSTEADQEFYKTKSETSLSTKLTGALAMKLSFIMNLDTSVGPETEELDTEAAVTLVYQFF